MPRGRPRRRWVHDPTRLVAAYEIEQDDAVNSTADFWSGVQPGFRFTRCAPGTPKFFRDVEQYRYALEPHIPEIARFDEWRGADVLEVGCGIGTDASQFARAGASYTGVDQTDRALELARQRFALDGLDGTLVRADATATAVILRRVAPVDREFVAGHVELLRIHGLRYPTDGALFLSNNTDGPGNPLLKVYSRSDACDLFSAFSDVDVETRYLNVRLYPKGDRLAATRLARRLERRIAWHLYIRAKR